MGFESVETDVESVEMGFESVRMRLGSDKKRFERKYIGGTGIFCTIFSEIFQIKHRRLH